MRSEAKMSKNEKRKLARYGHVSLLSRECMQATRSNKKVDGVTALGKALVMYGKADIVGYESHALSRERRRELVAAGVTFKA